MELNHLAVEGAPSPSASIALLRDSSEGLEVFLLRRHGNSAAFGGAHVFAGGKVEPEDFDLDAALHLDQAPALLTHQLGEAGLEESHGAAVFVAAVRELFEEAGVLLACGADASVAHHLRAHIREGKSFHGGLTRWGLRLQTTLLAPWSRWITPKVPGVSRRRFDTRFFLSRVPPDQVPTHDNQEAIDSIWLTPHAALQAYWDREIDLAPPQIMGLVQLARHPRVDDALREALSRPPPCIEPHSFMENGQRAVCYPGDPLHPQATRCMEGPTRLYFRTDRFEPEKGLPSLMP